MKVQAVREMLRTKSHEVIFEQAKNLIDELRRAHKLTDRLPRRSTRATVALKQLGGENDAHNHFGDGSDLPSSQSNTSIVCSAIQ
jgi:hypothetical protein